MITSLGPDSGPRQPWLGPAVQEGSARSASEGDGSPCLQLRGPVTFLRVDTNVVARLRGWASVEDFHVQRRSLTWSRWGARVDRAAGEGVIHEALTDRRGATPLSSGPLPSS
jgi:hypothetical protein